MAGLNAKMCLASSTAVALEYGRNRRDNEFVVVFDWDGGGCDISILELGDGVFEVKATHGAPLVTGAAPMVHDALIEVLVVWLNAEFRQDTGVDLLADLTAALRLKEEAERAKIALSAAGDYTINLPYIAMTDQGPVHLTRSLSREDFEMMLYGVIDRAQKACDAALAAAHLEKSEIQTALMVGGSTRVPMIRDSMQKYFGRAPHRGIPHDEAAVLGAAMEGAVMSGDAADLLLLDVAGATLSFKAAGDATIPLIEKNKTIPTRKSTINTTQRDNQQAVTIEVYEGEGSDPESLTCVGTIELAGIAPAARGEPRLEIAFDLDARYVFTASVKDLNTGHEESFKPESMRQATF